MKKWEIVPCTSGSGASRQRDFPRSLTTPRRSLLSSCTSSLPTWMTFPIIERRFEFDNLDFHFNDYRIDLQFGERCIDVHNLPAYNVVGIATGESTDEGRLWEAAVSFNE